MPLSVIPLVGVIGGGGGGSGTVTSVAVTTAAGVSGSVANPTTTPAITLTLGAITPTLVASSGAVSGANLSGTNTGDQTSVTGNAGTATALATGRTISITGDATYTSASFNGSTNVTGAITLTSVATGATAGSSSAIPVITFNNKGLVTGITSAAVIAPAGTLTGTTLAANVVTSSLTSLGVLDQLYVNSTGGVSIQSGDYVNLTGSLVVNIASATAINIAGPGNGTGIYIQDINQTVAINGAAGVTAQPLSGVQARGAAALRKRSARRGRSRR